MGNKIVVQFLWDTVYTWVQPVRSRFGRWWGSECWQIPSADCSPSRFHAADPTRPPPPSRCCRLVLVTSSVTWRWRHCCIDQAHTGALLQNRIVIKSPHCQNKKPSCR